MNPIKGSALLIFLSLLVVLFLSSRASGQYTFRFFFDFFSHFLFFDPLTPDCPPHPGFSFPLFFWPTWATHSIFSPLFFSRTACLLGCGNNLLLCFPPTRMLDYTSCFFLLLLPQWLHSTSCHSVYPPFYIPFCPRQYFCPSLLGSFSRVASLSNFSCSRPVFIIFSFNA